MKLFGAHCEYLCVSGGSFTCKRGPVLNPHNKERQTGGSSSGCAALVSSGEVEMALGGDQAGSVRVPASWCGVVGLKPTFGLVPYTSVVPINPTRDHVGIITKNVRENALLLECVAGYDGGLDSRQNGMELSKLESKSYLSFLDQTVQGLKMGFLEEGFSLPQSEKEVDEKVRDTAKVFEEMGMIVSRVSVPWHLKEAKAIWRGVALEEGAKNLVECPSGMNGFFSTSLVDANASFKHKADSLSETVKVSLIGGNFVRETDKGHFYSKAQNLRRVLAKKYDQILQQVHVIALPTTPMVATLFPKPNDSLAEKMKSAYSNLANTFQFNLTGHPAISIPCATHNGLPVGLQLIAAHYNEGLLYRVANAFEKRFDWNKN